MTTIAEQRIPHPDTDDDADDAGARSGCRDETGAVSAEYAVVTAAGVGIGGILIALVKSEFFMELVKRVLGFFLGEVGLA